MSAPMKISKWGNSLAVRLPAELVRTLGLKEGDYIEQDRLALHKARLQMSRDQALKVMLAADTPLPDEYRFDRDETNARD